MEILKAIIIDQPLVKGSRTALVRMGEERGRHISPSNILSSNRCCERVTGRAVSLSKRYVMAILKPSITLIPIY